jgi:long-chain acyl-CoA synthetase
VSATPIQSLADMLLRRVAATPEAEAYRFPVSSGWQSMTWREVGERVRAIACGLHALGLYRQQRCAILSATRIEWILADLGILAAGGATTTIYPANTAPESQYILDDSASLLVFVENADLLGPLSARQTDLASTRHAVVLVGAVPAEARHWAVSLDEFMRRGHAWDAENPGKFVAIAAAVRPDELATLVYTSGTTGRPKGVELLHDCWIYEAEAIAELQLLAPADLQYLWLPLSHIFGKVLEAAQLLIGFTSAVDGRVDRMAANLPVIRPTFVAAVPRVLEKVHNKISMTAAAGGGLRARIFHWAMAVGRRATARVRDGQPVPILLALQHGLASRLVFAKIQARFGGRLRFFISGSAPLSREIAEFFHAAGVLICEGYGLTESSAASCVNRPQAFRFGSVGLPLPGTEIAIAPQDGEILIRGRGVMRGYHHLPEVSAETLGADGWLRTGDIGRLDADGYLHITDRKKDLIKTSGGKYVAPQTLEGRLKASCPYLSQVVVHGDNRNFCVALVTLDEEAVRAWGKDHGLAELSLASLAADERVRALLEPYFGRLNASLARYETIKDFAILPNDLTIEAGELTPSLKVKRKFVEQRYQSILDGFYRGAT